MSDNCLRVAYLGQPGSYSEAAAVDFFGDSSVETLSHKDFDNIFDAVTQGSVDRGIVPLENSLAGSIHRNYDLLLRHEPGVRKQCRHR